MKVLVIEDDREILEVISVGFEMGWPEMKLVSTRLGREGVELAASENPDVVILDLGLPDITGFEVLKEIRAFSKVPILILTVRSDEADVVRGLEWGADDYMTKPFHQAELQSRLEALIRPADAPEP
ncbi:MAG: response regulator transcription factor [Dehalococcoidales bacterium]